MKSPPLYAKAHAVLRSAILRGQLRPGERLSESQLAERLGISRTPLREAVRQLCAEGLLHQGDFGLAVATLDLHQVELMLECRIALEQVAVRRAARLATPGDVAALQGDIAASRGLVGGEHLPDLLAQNVEFHRRLARIGGNDWNLRLLEQVWAQIVLFRASANSQPADEEQVLSEHTAILQLVAAGDAEAAAAAMQAHLLGDLARARRQLARLAQSGE